MQALPSILELIVSVSPVARVTRARAAALALGFIFAPPVPDAIDAITSAITPLVSADIGKMRFISPARSQSAVPMKSQSNALSAYNKAVSDFKSILSERRAQIDSNQQLPNLPGQALYLARNNMVSAYKDLTDALPSKIGRPNKFGIPPAYFDADNEPLFDEYADLFKIMEAPPVNRKTRTLRLKTLSTWERISGAPRVLTWHMRTWPVASVWAYSSLRQTATKT